MSSIPSSLTATLPSGTTVTVARAPGEGLEAMERRLREEVRRASEPTKATTFIDR